ncbi:MAG: cache and HAMP domain-containing protein, partial [Candidatus Omnitrophica bacterium]|nr:cache and HAMP domain-containing protein [Candidatus Omnitrophota bacterium]
MKIANKITLSFFIPAIILTLFGATVFYYAARGSLKESVSSHLMTAAGSRAKHIDTFLRMHKDIASHLSQSVILKSLLQANQKDGDYSFKYNEALKRLKRAGETDATILEAILLDKNGKIIAASSGEMEVGEDQSKASFFVNAKEAPYITDAFFCEECGKPVIAVSSPVFSKAAGGFSGVVVNLVDMTALNKITTDRTGLGISGEIYLVNKEGLMITPSRFFDEKGSFKMEVDTENTRRALKEALSEEVNPGEYAPIVFKDYRGVKVLGVHDHIEEMEWLLLAERNENEAFRALLFLKFVLAILVVVIIAAALGISLFVAKHLTEPIVNLKEKVNSIGKGDLDTRAAIDSDDEIGDLSRAFDNMTGNLKESITMVGGLNEEIAKRKKLEKQLIETQQQLI